MSISTLQLPYTIKMTPLPQREKMAVLIVLRKSSQNDCMTEPAKID